MVDIARPLFGMGRLLATPAALQAMEGSGQSPAEFLGRHVRGDWGAVSEGDGLLNDDAVKDGTRILSAYVTNNGTKIWIITEATGDDGKRVATTILLPEEY